MRASTKGITRLRGKVSSIRKDKAFALAGWLASYSSPSDTGARFSNVTVREGKQSRCDVIFDATHGPTWGSAPADIARILDRGRRAVGTKGHYELTHNNRKVIDRRPVIPA